MTKKLLAICAAVMLTLSVMTGCSKDDAASSDNGSSQNSSSQAETSAADSSEADTSTDDSKPEGDPNLKAPVADGPIDAHDGPTDNMLTRSILREGDTSRLVAKLKRATDGNKEITKICYLGDSITAGSVASSNNQYTNRFTRWFEDNVSYYVDSQNAGIGATDSYLAVHRAERDVLAYEPDIIFIEFINDADNDFYKSAMDSLVRKCLAAENAPAVILIEMTMEDGTCPQNVHSQIGEAYDLPVISYHDAVLPEVEAGNISWKSISPDNIHPNDDGHVMLGKMLINYVKGVYEKMDTLSDEITTELPESPTGDVFANATLVNRDSDVINVTDEGGFTEAPAFQGYFSNGWGTTSGGTMTFEVEARNIGLVYNKNVDGTYGTAAISVDGGEAKMINADFPGGWGSYACSEQVYTSDATAKHTVTITILDGDKQNFDIYSLLIS